MPFALKNAIDTELNCLVDTGILKKVKFSRWATPIVPVPKKDSRLCLCGDYKVTVNQSLEIDPTSPAETRGVVYRRETIFKDQHDTSISADGLG